MSDDRQRSFSATAGRRVITPHNPVPLCGFLSRKGTFSSVNDPLELNAVRLRQGKEDVWLVSADLAYGSPSLMTVVRSHRLTTGPDRNVVLGASHTHFAPSMVPHFPALGITDPRYEAFVLDQARELIDDIEKRPPMFARLVHSKGEAKHSVNRRRRDIVARAGRVQRKWVMAPNADGARDETVHVLGILDDEGKLAAVVWEYACHPVSFPAQDRVSADFPGVVRKEIRRLHGADLPVIFLQGFSGNTRPRILAKPASILDRIRDTLNGPQFGRHSMSEFERWADGIADVVSTTLQRAIDSAPLTPMLSFDSQRVAHGDFILGTAPPIKDLELLRADLTADLSLAVVSAEAMVEHLAAFQLQSPQMTFIPVGCANTSVGYIPTSRIASEGGYEGGECLAYFDVRGRFSERADQIFYGAVLGLENVRRRSVATTN